MKDLLKSLKYKITIQKEDIFQNEFGENVSSVINLDNIWAKIENLGEKFVRENNNIICKITYKITIHFKPEIDKTYKIQYENQTFNIIAFDHITYNKVASVIFVESI